MCGMLSVCRRARAGEGGCEDPSSRLGQSTERGAIVLASMAKMFVGEMVERSREQMAANGETGAIEPHHLRQSYRKMQDAGVVPSCARHRSTRFWRADAGA